MSAQVETERNENAYDFRAMEAKWRPYWDERGFQPTGDAPKGRKYVLDMFPYPSGDLHMGHAEAFAIGDMNARYFKQCGYDVLHPIGWDSFGLPAENAAIKNDTHPKEWTYKNIETQAESFKRYAIAADWSRRLHTSDPEYYKWTQWLFEQFYKKGLAYRKDSMVNWCPKDQTVLANEQVVNGACERCGTTVTKKSLNQWYFKITDYAQQLLDDMEQLEGKWPDRVLLMQRNWIGRSEGAEVRFEIEATEDQAAESFTVFTTRPDTLYGATFIVVAADAAFAEQIVAPEHKAALEQYREDIKALSDIDRQSSDREKTGVFTGLFGIDPVNGREVPIFVADYVLWGYGTGAIMAVPAHDDRDWAFARAYDLDVVRTIGPADDPYGPDLEAGAYTGDGVAVDSANDEIDLNGLGKDEAKAAMTAWLTEKGLGKRTVTYRLRDWLFSRQRYWGEPFPIVWDEDGVAHALPEEMLPVELPEVSDYSPRTFDPDDADSSPELRWAAPRNG